MRNLHASEFAPAIAGAVSRLEREAVLEARALLFISGGCRDLNVWLFAQASLRI